MGWESELFAVLEDLEQQAEGLYAAEREAELRDRSRAEYQQVTLAARLMASLERDLTLDVLGVGAVAGRLDRVGTGWCLATGAGQDWLVHLDAVAAVGGCSERAVPEVAWSPLTRLGLGSALRRLAEAGERCLVHRRDGARHDGVPRRVGADFVELADDREIGGRAPARVTLVPFATLAAVQSRP